MLFELLRTAITERLMQALAVGRNMMGSSLVFCIWHATIR